MAIPRALPLLCWGPVYACRHLNQHWLTYLDLPYGTYFCRFSKTLELLPFLRKLWEIVSPRGRVFSPFGRVFSPFGRVFSPFGRAFSPLKNGFGINISEDTLVCPKRSFLCKTYLLGKRQKLSTFWRGRYMSSLFHLFDAFIHPHSRALLASEHVHTAAPQVYVFAVIFAQAVSDHRSDPDACLSMLVVKIFPGSLFSWVWPLRLYLITYLYNGLKLPVLLSSRWHLTWLRHGYPIESWNFPRFSMMVAITNLSITIYPNSGCAKWLKMNGNDISTYYPTMSHWYSTGFQLFAKCCPTYYGSTTNWSPHSSRIPSNFHRSLRNFHRWERQRAGPRTEAWWHQVELPKIANLKVIATMPSGNLT